MAGFILVVLVVLRYLRRWLFQNFLLGPIIQNTTSVNSSILLS